LDNKSIVKTLKLFAQLLELHEENPFKIKNFTNANFKLSKYAEPLSSKSLEDLAKIDGVGKSAASKIVEFIETGVIEELEALKQITPAGIIDMLQIKGIGPKKIRIIWTELNIDTIGELYYACNENRLVEAKGFGYKTQEDVKKQIEFFWSNTGKNLYANALMIANEFEAYLKKEIKDITIECTGEMRRKCEIIHQIEFLLNTTNKSDLQLVITEKLGYELQIISELEWKIITENQTIILCYFSDAPQFANRQFSLTAHANHLNKIENFDAEILTKIAFENEQAIYEHFQLPYIAPELREGLNEIDKAKFGQIPTLIELSDLQGSLHNHSTYSDGIHSLKEMADYCESLGYSYLGICDHSQSAFYANGLKADRVLAQQLEIKKLNAANANFTIFSGIESDILSDGSLDYPAEILSTFDFIVASIHSNLKMDEAKATARLLKAIENPYTTMLGHPTGRLLLARAGYPIDHTKVIDACAANGVAIEINANPLRLDLDWRYIDYAISKGVMLSINPDAHRKEGYLDMFYGIAVARKGCMSKANCLNTFSREAIFDYFQQRKNKI
jgi:DNA polymerase (family 10)